MVFGRFLYGQLPLGHWKHISSPQPSNSDWFCCYSLHLNRHNVKVAQKAFETLGHIFAKPRDPVTKEQRTDAIYSIPCNDCDNEYIGQTKRQFGTRLKEH